MRKPAIKYRRLGPTKTKREHVQVAERALGHALPKGTHVHHVNGNGLDNRPCNLVICQDAAYHRFLHRRQRIKDAGGNPNTQKICGRCHVPKDIADFGSRGRLAQYCRACAYTVASIRSRREATPCSQCGCVRLRSRKPLCKQCASLKVSAVTVDQILEVRRRLSAGERPIAISRALMVSYNAIHNIKSGRQWGYVR